MMDLDLINSIKSIDDSIDFNEDSQVFVIEKVENWIDVARKLRQDFEFDYLMCITSLDLEEGKLSLAYNLHSTKQKTTVEFQLIFNEDVEVHSVESIWKTADWHEREAYDMMGIKFSNHPDMKRILLPEDWEGYPLKKDYKVADYYHGMHIPKDKTEWE